MPQFLHPENSAAGQIRGLLGAAVPAAVGRGGMTTLSGAGVGKGSLTWQDSKAQVVFCLAGASDECQRRGNLLHSCLNFVLCAQQADPFSETRQPCPAHLQLALGTDMNENIKASVKPVEQCSIQRQLTADNLTWFRLIISAAMIDVTMKELHVGLGGRQGGTKKLGGIGCVLPVVG